MTAEQPYSRNEGGRDKPEGELANFARDLIRDRAEFSGYVGDLNPLTIPRPAHISVYGKSPETGFMFVYFLVATGSGLWKGGVVSSGLITDPENPTTGITYQTEHKFDSDGERTFFGKPRTPLTGNCDYRSYPPAVELGQDLLTQIELEQSSPKSLTLKRDGVVQGRLERGTDPIRDLVIFPIERRTPDETERSRTRLLGVIEDLLGIDKADQLIKP